MDTQWGWFRRRWRRAGRASKLDRHQVKWPPPAPFPSAANQQPHGGRLL